MIMMKLMVPYHHDEYGDSDHISCEIIAISKKKKSFDFVSDFAIFLPKS